MNRPTGKGILIVFLFPKYLHLGLSLMTLFIKRLWIIEKIWRIPRVCSLIVSRCEERHAGIKIKRVGLFIFDEKLFDGFLESIKAHPKRNEKKFGKTLVVFGFESLAAFKQTRSYLFESWHGIFMTVYT